MKLNQVTVGVTDYDAAVAFYTRLGLRQIVDSLTGLAELGCQPLGEAPVGNPLLGRVGDEAWDRTGVGRHAFDPIEPLR